ncbi:MAG: hypothetical protein GF353_11495 [Candidatus Lokiarchaeota archaeon]|nr:hypothetical protein [Candidatus Lokiarchaeota archaeon]
MPGIYLCSREASIEVITPRTNFKFKNTTIGNRCCWDKTRNTMIEIIKFLGLFFILYIIISIYKKLRFERKYKAVHNKFIALWDASNRDEKINLLYAIKGYELRQCKDDRKEIYLDKEYYKEDKDFGLRSTLIDCKEYWEEEIFDKTPVFESLPNRKLDRAFQEEFDYLRDLITISDYDEFLVSIETYFQYIFNHKSKLSKFFTKERIAYEKFLKKHGENINYENG